MVQGNTFFASLLFSQISGNLSRREWGEYSPIECESHMALPGSDLKTQSPSSTSSVRTFPVGDGRLTGRWGTQISQILTARHSRNRSRQSSAGSQKPLLIEPSTAPGRGETSQPRVATAGSGPWVESLAEDEPFGVQRSPVHQQFAQRSQISGVNRTDSQWRRPTDCPRSQSMSVADL